MQAQHDSRTRFLDATLKVVRTKGYTAARLEDICAEAGLTKGSFFHHFRSKEDLALAAVRHWDEHAANAFSDGAFPDQRDPLDRLLAYVDMRIAMLTGDVPEFTCFLGTIIQEGYRTHPELAAACADSLERGAAALERDIRAAIENYQIEVAWTPGSLTRHIEAVVQGGFVLAKAQGSAAPAADSLRHLRRYLEFLFRDAAPKNGAGKP